MIPSEKWILMMTGNYPKMRSGIHTRATSLYRLCVKHCTRRLPDKKAVIVVFCPLQVKEFLKKEFEKHGYSPNDTHHDVMVEDIFQIEDEDKDGFISTREFVYQHDEL